MESGLRFHAENHRLNGNLGQRQHGPSLCEAEPMTSMLCGGDRPFPRLLRSVWAAGAEEKRTEGGRDRRRNKQAGEGRASQSKKEVEEMLDQVSLLSYSHLLLRKVMFYPRGKLDLNSAILASLQSQSGNTFRLPKMSSRSSQTAAEQKKGDSSVKDDKTNLRCLLWVVRMTDRSNALINRLSEA